MCIILRAKCAYHERYTHSDLIEKKSVNVTKNQIEICEIMGLVGIFRKSKLKNSHLPKISLSVQIGVKVQAPLCSNDSIKNRLKLAWIVTFMIQVNFSGLLCFQIYYVNLKLNN